MCSSKVFVTGLIVLAAWTCRMRPAHTGKPDFKTMSLGIGDKAFEKGLVVPITGIQRKMVPPTIHKLAERKKIPVQEAAKLYKELIDLRADELVRQGGYFGWGVEEVMKGKPAVPMPPPTGQDVLTEMNKGIAAVRDWVDKHGIVHNDGALKGIDRRMRTFNGIGMELTRDLLHALGDQDKKDDTDASEAKAAIEETATKRAAKAGVSDLPALARFFAKHAMNTDPLDAEGELKVLFENATSNQRGGISSALSHLSDRKKFPIPDLKDEKDVFDLWKQEYVRGRIFGHIFSALSNEAAKLMAAGAH